MRIYTLFCKCFFNKKNAFFLLFLLPFLQYAQSPVGSIRLKAVAATNAKTYTVAGQNYTWGQGDDLLIEGVTVGGQFYATDLSRKVDAVIIRVDNPRAQGDLCSVLVQEEGGNNFVYSASFPGAVGNPNDCDLALSLTDPFVNRGANDLFKNVSNTANNIERVDIFYEDILTAIDSDLDNIGFLLSEKDANSGVKVAGIRTVGAGNTVTGYYPLQAVNGNTDYGSNLDPAGDGPSVGGELRFPLSWLIDRGAGNGTNANPNRNPTNNPVRVGGSGSSLIGVTFISLRDLGLVAGDQLFGVSFFGNDIIATDDLLDPSSFPNDTNAGGADVLGGLGVLVTNRAIVTGFVYIDNNANGVFDGPDTGIADVDVTVTDSVGNTQIVQTEADGSWSAFLTVPGDVTSSIDLADPDFPFTFTAQTEGTNPTISTNVAVLGQSNFTENDGFTSGGTIRGRLYLDNNGNGTFDAGDTPVPDVDYTVTDVLGRVETYTTDATGFFVTNTVPSANAIVKIDETDPEFIALGTIFQTEGTDPSNVTVVDAGITNDVHDGFAQNGTVTGKLYFDENGNGIFDTGDTGIPNVDVVVTDANGSQTVFTDANGDYVATVRAGSVTTNIDETDPDFPAGIRTENTDATAVIVTAGNTIPSGNDGIDPRGTISGHLYVDTNGNGVQDGVEPDLSNVDVIITDSNGTQTVSTDGSGNYTAQVQPGSVTSNIDETDPEFVALGTVVQSEGNDPTTIANAATGINRDLGNDGFNPVPTLNVTNTTRIEGNNLNFDITLSNASANAVEFTPSIASSGVNPATIGVDTNTPLRVRIGTGVFVDYTGGPITIPAGETVVRFQVPSVDDIIDEPNETFNLNLTGITNTTNTTASGLGTITDRYFRGKPRRNHAKWQ